MKAEDITPQMRADLDRQLARFTDEDLLPAVQAWREIRRQRAAAEQRKADAA